MKKLIVKEYFIHRLEAYTKSDNVTGPTPVPLIAVSAKREMGGYNLDVEF